MWSHVWWGYHCLLARPRGQTEVMCIKAVFKVQCYLGRRLLTFSGMRFSGSAEMKCPYDEVVKEPGCVTGLWPHAASPQMSRFGRSALGKKGTSRRLCEPLN